MHKPYFSVIIPAYNAAPFIDSTLRSVAEQSFPDYEIIIVNDGSSDGTPEAARKFFEGRGAIRFMIIDQPNRGIAAARNAGIRAAKGEYLAFLDADDRWYPDKLSAVRDFLIRNSGCDLVCHDEDWISRDGKKHRVTYGPRRSYKELLFSGNSLSTSAVVVRREKVVEAGCFSEDLQFNGVEDYELWLRLSRVCRIDFLHEALGEYRVHGGGITSRTDEQTDHLINVVEHHFAQWTPRNVFYHILMNRRRAAIWRRAGRDHLKTGQFAQTKDYAVKALRQYGLAPKTWGLLVLSLLRVRV